MYPPHTFMLISNEAMKKNDDEDKKRHKNDMALICLHTIFFIVCPHSTYLCVTYVIIIDINLLLDDIQSFISSCENILLRQSPLSAFSIQTKFIFTNWNCK